MTKYAPGDLLTLQSGNIWKVARLSVEEETGRGSVGLVNPKNSNHGTGFYVDVLDRLVVEHHRPGLFRKSSGLYTPAVNGDGDVQVRLTFDTECGESMVGGLLTRDQLAEIVESIMGKPL